LSGLLVAGQKLVGIGRSGDREQRKNRNNSQNFHGQKLDSDCGQKRLCLVQIRDDPGKHHDLLIIPGFVETRARPTRFGRLDPRDDALNACRIKAIDALEKSPANIS
jgi:hypothetical protein